MKRPNTSPGETSARAKVEVRSTTRRLPSLDSSRTFEVAARRLSFTEAASELCVTQSAVSQRIKSLESELGATLFERTPRGLRLSRTGARLADGVREGMVYFASAVAEVHAHGAAGTLDITTLPSFASLWLLPRLPDFSHSHPEIEIRLHVDERLVDLRASHLDAALRFGDGQYQGLAVKRLMGDAVVPGMQSGGTRPFRACTGRRGSRATAARARYPDRNRPQRVRLAELACLRRAEPPPLQGRHAIWPGQPGGRRRRTRSGRGACAPQPRGGRIQQRTIGSRMATSGPDSLLLLLRRSAGCAFQCPAAHVP